MVTSNDYDVNYDGSDQELLTGFASIRNIAIKGCSKSRKKIVLMKIREKNNYLIFKAFVHYFLRYTVPKKLFFSKRSTMTVSEIFTAADEAFCILCMMNYWDEWEWRNSHGEDSIRKNNRKTYWTSCSNLEHGGDDDGDEVEVNEDGEQESIGGRGSSSSTVISDLSTSTGGSRRNIGRDYVCGWNREGRARYNEILRHILKLRRMQDHKKMEQRLMNEYMKEDSNKRNRKRKRYEENDDLDEGDDVVIDMYAVENGDINFSSV